MAFVKDKEVGEEAERWLLHLLRRAGIEAEMGSRESAKDLSCEFDGRPFTVEVKFDRYEARSGNMCVEHWNPKRNAPSGVTATKADLWVHVVTRPLVAYVCTVASLRDFLASEPPDRALEGVGDGNASVFLYRTERALPLFFALSEASPYELPDLLEALLDGAAGLFGGGRPLREREVPAPGGG